MDSEALRLRAEDDLIEADISQELLSSEVFQGWLDAQLEDAKARCVRVVENHSSNYEKAMAAGILRYWRHKRLEMESQVSKDYRQKRTKRLEELNGERTRSRKSGPFPGVKAYGQF